MPENKDQHFLPISYMRGFACDYPKNIEFGRKKLAGFVYNRKEGTVRKKGLINIAKQSYMYSFVMPDGKYDHSLEQEFAKFESNILNISKGLYDDHVKVHKPKPELLMNNEIRDGLAYYISLQFKRTPKIQRNIERLVSTSPLFQEPVDKKNTVNSILAGIGEKQEGDLPSFCGAFLKKKWILFVIIDDDRRFVTTDLPVSLFNHDGIGKEETEIWFPVNEKIMLVMHGFGEEIFLRQLSRRNRPDDNSIIRKLNEGMSKLAENLIISSNENLLNSLAAHVPAWQYAKKASNDRK